jgi:hypothetical protein
LPLLPLLQHHVLKHLQQRPQPHLPLHQPQLQQLPLLQLSLSR